MNREEVENELLKICEGYTIEGEPLSNLRNFDFIKLLALFDKQRDEKLDEAKFQLGIYINTLQQKNRSTTSQDFIFGMSRAMELIAELKKGE